METRRKIICIAGLPASGKTHYASELSKKLEALLIDDPRDVSKLRKQVTEFNGKNIIIVDPHFCFIDTRISACKILWELGFDVEWIYFANDPEQCKINARTRPKKRVIRAIESFSLHYIIPEHEKIIPVWRDKT